ncbi:ribosomal protein S18 acetylase RimI-like enzyme [Cytobacillus eiseniae]|uniref:Ribosomal protein S18 acetylase RimI-like enzyme n=1 Tax=Cytobacillus eiseniae TaxID=762947 RepID=A0ABS4RIL7_9BACI|nr:GNAT family N-acetyltransferase [Cytobacillus eiseniae]MBP2242752.1 ribosomal protein S18 acetylase RimI-like enzyme [Cytobacillus eiseniae]
MLTTKQLKEIKELQEICEKGEPFQLKLNWDMLQSREANEINDFFHYEDGKLVGFLGLYGFGNKVEVCGMVAPSWRRKGIFTKLYLDAAEILKERGVQEILFNAPAKSESAKLFLKTIPCSYAFSEYQMKWEERELREQKDVTLRLANDDDFETIIQLDVQCFGFEDADAHDYNIRISRNNSEQFYIIEAEGHSVGKMRVDHQDGEAWIYGFAVFPGYQGKGIGRKALTNVLIEEHKKGFPIFLEVEATNANALGLYESCSFKAYHVQDYYKY